MRVQVSTTQFQFAHGRAPRGQGRWWFFGVGDQDGWCFSFTGTYSEAKAAARKAAAEDGVWRVEVGS